MTLTRLWSSLLALLATAMLAGLFLLAAGTNQGFSDADKSAIEAVTNAGTAALHAEIESSPVTLGPSLLGDTRMQEALAPSAEAPAEGEVPLQQTLYEVANETLLKDYPLMSVAFIDGQNQVLARTGMDEGLFDEVVGITELRDADGEARFSATLGGRLHAVQVSRKVDENSDRRLVAIQAVNLRGNSLLRRVLGTNPAGLVRGGAIVGEPMGGASPEDLKALVAEHEKDVPPAEGASKVFELGQGANTRIGSISRVPGPAGKGDTPTYLAVLSLNTLGVVDRDLASALKGAQAEGMSHVPWPIIGGFFLIALVMGWYLPRMEAIAPLKRLAGEFVAMAEGRQHQIFHDTYRGAIRDVARASVVAQEHQRVAIEAELIGDGDEETEHTPVPRRRRGLSTRSRPVVRDEPESPPDAIELPGGGGGSGPAAEIESHSHATPNEPPPSSAPAPAIDEDSDAISLGAAGLGFSDDSAPFNAPDPGAGGLLGDGGPGGMLGGGGMGGGMGGGGMGGDTTDDPREAYFQEVYNEFVALKETCGEDVDNFPYEKFAKKLRKNTEQLLERDGIADVKFNVYIKDGKAALKAKVVKA